MRIIFRLIVLICVFHGFLFSSDTGSKEVSGRVIDMSTGKIIIGANVVDQNTGTGVASDNSGRFTLELRSDGPVVLVATCVGYQEAVKRINFETGDSVWVVFDLAPTVIQIDAINVTADRFGEDNFVTPSNVSITTEARFRERPFSTTAEILREEPAVLVQKTTYAHGAPIIRGLIGKYVLLLYDGIRLNRPTLRFGANQYLNTVDLNSLERIEVIRGPSSVMYGSDAIGGAVNLIPQILMKRNDHVNVESSVIGRYSSADDGFSSGVNFTGNYNRFSSAVNFTYKDIGDLRAGGDVGRQQPTGWDETDLSCRLVTALDDNNTLGCDYLSVRQNSVPRYDKYVSGDFQKYIYDPQNRDLIGVSFNSDINGKVLKSLKANFSYGFEKEGRTEQKTGSSSTTKSLDKINSYGTHLQLLSALHPKHLLTFGWEYYYDRVNSSACKITDAATESVRGAYPDNSRYYSGGIFLQDEWTLTSGAVLTAGARFSRIKVKTPLEEPYGLFEETYHSVTGSIAAKYSLTETVNLFAKWSQGFRAPNLNDVAVLKTSSSGVDVPSPGLDAEKCNNFEGGLKLKSDRFTGSLFIYYNRLQGLIDRVPGIYDGKTFFDENDNGIKDPGEFDVYQKANIQRAEIYGLEGDGNLKMEELWSVRFNCFWTYGRDLTGREPLSRIPPVMGLLAVRKIQNDNLWYEIYLRLAGSQRRLSARDIDDSRIDNSGTPGWVTFNLRCRYTVSHFEIGLNLENITDKAYKEHGSGVYSPGRNFLVSLKYSPF